MPTTTLTMQRDKFSSERPQFGASLGESGAPIAVSLIAGIDDGSAQNKLGLIALFHQERQQELERRCGIIISASPRPMFFIESDFFEKDLSGTDNIVSSATDKFAVHCDNESRGVSDPRCPSGTSHQFLSQPQIAFAIDDSAQPRQIDNSRDVVGFDHCGDESLGALGLQALDPSPSIAIQLVFVDNIQPFFKRTSPAPASGAGSEDAKLFASSQFALENKGIYALSANPEQRCDFINSVGAHTMNTIVAQAEMQANMRVI